MVNRCLVICKELCPLIIGNGAKYAYYQHEYRNKTSAFFYFILNSLGVISYFLCFLVHIVRDNNNHTRYLPLHYCNVTAIDDCDKRFSDIVNTIDTDRECLLAMLAMVDEIERDLINERIKDGLRVRKAKGVVLDILTVEKAG